ncbi:hypothetical protein BGZ65_002265, partial [Modicella reniformis]
QEREKTRIQYELEQAQLRAQKEVGEKEAQLLAAKAAAEEAEREAVRLKRAKSLHLKETLASLEAKRDRTDNRTVQLTSPNELKHLEKLSLLNEQYQQQSQGKQTDRIFLLVILVFTTFLDLNVAITTVIRHNTQSFLITFPADQAARAIYPFYQAPANNRSSFRDIHLSSAFSQ